MYMTNTCIVEITSRCLTHLFDLFGKLCPSSSYELLITNISATMANISETLQVYLDVSPSYASVDKLPIISSPNMSSRPEPFPKRTELELSELRHPQWSSNKYPFLAWVPKNIRFEGPLLGRLNLHYQSYPVESHDDGWILSQDLRNQWQRLEYNLYTFASSLVERAKQAGQLTEAFTFWPLPSCYGYLKSYSTHEDAREYATYSKEAFVPLIAACSFAIANNIYGPDDEFPVPSWFHYFTDKGVHPQYLHNIQNSIIGDFTLDRAGVLIDPYSWKWKQLPALLRTRVPIWIHWGEKWDEETLDPELALRCRPSQAEVSEARNSFSSSSTSDFVQVAPQPYEHTGQKRGETWQAFFARRAAKNENRLRAETQEERVRRVNHEKAVGMPGKSSKAARVYEWVETDGFLLRKYVERVYVEHVWDCYGPNQRRYDGFHNEWDLCEEFDPPDIIDNDRWNYIIHGPSCPDLASLESQFAPPPRPPPSLQDPGIDMYPPGSPGTNCTAKDAQTSNSDAAPLISAFSSAPSPVPSPVPSSVPSLPSTSDAAFSISTFSSTPSSVPSLSPVPQTPSTSPAHQSIATLNNLNSDFLNLSPDDPAAEQSHWTLHSSMDSFEDSLLHRYGLILNISHNVPHVRHEDKKWIEARRILGYEGDKTLKSWYRPIAISFVEYMTNRTNSPPIRDLTENPNVVQDSNINITCLSNGTYLIRPKTMNPAERNGWALVVADPATALQCARSEWGPEKFDIARELLGRGIRFNTMEPLNVNPRNLRKRLRRCPGLGYRQVGYKPDLLDYKSYEELRDRFLRQPFGRAALLEGGIVWRLSLEALGIAPALDGPATDAIAYGIHTAAVDSSGRTFTLYDDALSEEETDLICGVYKIYTGICLTIVLFLLTDPFFLVQGRGTQTMDGSWWPKPRIFEKSGLFWGYWTPKCEAWFQGRLRDILAGNATVISGNQWRISAIRFQQSQASRLVTANSKHSAEYLQALSPP